MPRTKAAKNEPNKLRRFFKILGPGFITGASDDDPSGIATYSQAGASFGYATLWMALFTFPLIATVEYLCSKIGIVSGQGLASILRQHYPRWVLLLSVSFLMIANTINAGADIGAVAEAVHMLLPAISHDLAICAVTGILVVLLVFGSYSLIVSTFKWLTLSLFAYLATAIFVHADFREVLLHTFIPTFRLDSDFIAVVVAILGTTISPYLLFWQATEEVEEQRAEGLSDEERKGASKDDLKYAAVDVNVGMFFSNLVMYFIIFATAASLHGKGVHTITGAEQAALALKPVAGDWAYLLFALGLIGTGFLAIPVLVGSAAFAVSEALKLPCGFNEKWYRAKQFYFVIGVATLLGAGMNFLKINAMQALFWTSVINGVLAPPLLTIIMFVASNKKIMGEHTCKPWLMRLGWFTTIIMYIAAAALLATMCVGK